MRLDKFLSTLAVGSRSEVKRILKAGLISVNGQPVKDAACKINPEQDVVELNGTTLSYSAMEYYMLNKPSGTVSAVTDHLHPTVMDFISSPRKRELFPVGRLDIDTEGFLLITNDGKLAHELLSPKKHVGKTYLALTYGQLNSDDIKQLEDGIDIGEAKPTLPAIAKCHGTQKLSETDAYRQYGRAQLAKTAGMLPEQLNPDMVCSHLELTIHEGKYHQVKRMLLAVGKPVLHLKRIAIGDLPLDETLQEGESRPLTKEELRMLLFTQ